MNICFYTSALPDPLIGGVERVTYNLSRYFQKIGLNVYFLTIHGEHPGRIPDNISVSEKIGFVNTFLLQHKIDVLIDQYGQLPFLSHPYIPQQVYIIQCYHLDVESRHLARSLVETFSFSTLKYSLMNLAYLMNIPRRRLINLFKFREKIKNRSIDKFVYLSESFLPRVRIQMGGGDNQAITAIPNAVCEDLLSLPRIKPEKKKKQIMWCGRMAQNPKNVLFLPRLWEKLMDKYPDWEFVLVGGGIDRNLVEKRISKKNLTRIRITGYVCPDTYYAESRIFVLPSYSEGFGMVLVEAMAHSCVPVVFDTSKAYHDIIEDGKNGFIVPDDDEDAFIDAVELLMKDEALISHMSEKAHNSIKKFSIDKIGFKWLELFENRRCGKKTMENNPII